MATVRVLVLRAPGINCDEETVYAWQRAGADVQLVHINQLVETPQLINDMQIVTVPGGFSYGDDLGAGVILAQRVRLHLLDALRSLVDRGGAVLGICNGFQVLVKTGLLATDEAGRRQVTVTYNDSARFEARWVRLQVCTDRCLFLEPGELLELPIEHAEGKVVVADETVPAALEASGQLALRYVTDTGAPGVSSGMVGALSTGVAWPSSTQSSAAMCCTGDYPANPNGSVAGIAGLCDATGRVLGLMPHPERCLEPTNHPCWTRRPLDHRPAAGLQLFARAVAHYR